MATFLQLCGDLARESGAVGTAPTSVTGQTGRQDKTVGWVATAWKLIQNLNPHWSFLRGEFSGALVPSTMTYSAASWNVSRFGEWVGDYGRYRPVSVYDPATGRADQSHLRQMSWERWKDSYDFGTHDAQRPTEYALAPDQTMRFGAKPDKAYIVRGEYRKAPQVLTANDDVPDMPSRFHDIIVWRAIMLMGDHDEAPMAIGRAQEKYAEQLVTMQRDLLPSFDVRADGPLA